MRNPPKITADKTASAPYTVETYCPAFGGFYGSVFEPSEGDLEYLFPEHIPAEISALLEDGTDYSIDYRAYYEATARAIFGKVTEKLQEIFPCLTGGDFQKLVSPREYNFTNDSIDCRFSFTSERAARAALLRYVRENRAAFADFVRDRYTSRSGFIGYYSDEPETWIDYLKGNGAGADLSGHFLGAFFDFVLENKAFGDYEIYSEMDEQGPSLYESTAGPVFDLSESDFDKATSEPLKEIADLEKHLTLYAAAMRTLNPATVEKHAAPPPPLKKPFTKMPSKISAPFTLKF